MPLAAAPTRRIPIDVNGETVVFVCRVPSAAELSKFLNGRFATVRNKVNSRVYEAREEFINKIAVDVENATYAGADGIEKPLSAATALSDEDKTFWSGMFGQRVESWKDLIPLSWKSSAAQRFEDSANVADEETKNWRRWSSNTSIPSLPNRKKRASNALLPSKTPKATAGSANSASWKRASMQSFGNGRMA
jgi:hypothetical protein